jgi:hypothetical protein
MLPSNPELAETLALEDELDSIDPALIDIEFETESRIDPTSAMLTTLDCMSHKELLAMAEVLKDTIKDLDDIATGMKLEELRTRLKKIRAMGNGTLN